MLRVATSYDGYDDIWYVNYKYSENEKRILEDDRVVIYGECTGLESYLGALGTQVTIPSMDAKYVTVEELSVPQFETSILQFDIQKETYGDNYEYYAIVEIKNKGDSNLYLKDIRFDIEDSEGHLVDTNDSLIYSCPDVIKPNESGYLYTFTARDLDGVESIDNLVFVPQFNAVSVNTTPAEYDVSDVSISNGSYGVSTTGRITNNTTEDNSYIYVSVVYYNAEGKILGISGTSVTGLTSGRAVSFEINGMMMGNEFSAEDVSDYRIIASDSYYNFDPEGPSVSFDPSMASVDNDTLINAVEEAIEGQVGNDEKITGVAFDGKDITITVDISGADTSLFSAEEIAESRMSSITDAILKLDNSYFNSWETITLDFGSTGKATLDKSMIKDEGIGKYFDFPAGILN